MTPQAIISTNSFKRSRILRWIATLMLLTLACALISQLFNRITLVNTTGDLLLIESVELLAQGGLDSSGNQTDSNCWRLLSKATLRPNESVVISTRPRVGAATRFDFRICCTCKGEKFKSLSTAPKWGGRTTFEFVGGQSLCNVQNAETRLRLSGQQLASKWPALHKCLY